MIKLKIKYGNSQTDLRFPCTEKALQEALAEIGAEQVRPLELYVTEVVFPEELDFLQDRFANLDEVNYLAKRMDSFFGNEGYQFYEAMKLEGFDTLPDLINLSFNLNRYPLIQNIGDMGKIGREYLLTVNGCVPAHDEDDPKYAQLGRELIQSGKSDHEESQEIARLNAEISKTLNTFDFDKEALKQKMLTCVSEKYISLGTEEITAQSLKDIFKSTPTLTAYDSNLTDQAVSEIQPKENGTISLVLINGQRIGKEKSA